MIYSLFFKLQIQKLSTVSRVIGCNVIFQPPTSYENIEYKIKQLAHVLFKRSNKSKCLFLMLGGAVKLSHSDDLTQTGQTTRVKCTVTSETFKGWFKSDGTKVPQSGRVSVSSNADVHTLTITQAQLSDGGTYKCSGSNNQATYTFYVKCKYL